MATERKTHDGLCVGPEDFCVKCNDVKDYDGNRTPQGPQGTVRVADPRNSRWVDVPCDPDMQVYEVARVAAQAWELPPGNWTLRDRFHEADEMVTYAMTAYVSDLDENVVTFHLHRLSDER